MLRDGEDRVFGELWRKPGPQARPNNFLLGSLPGYGGHVSTEIQWARKIDALSSSGPLGFGTRRGSPQETAVDLFQSRSTTPFSMRRLQVLQSPAQQQHSYVSNYDKKGNLTRRLNSEQKEMCSWYVGVPVLVGAHEPRTMSWRAVTDDDITCLCAGTTRSTTCRDTPATSLLFGSISLEVTRLSTRRKEEGE